MRRLAGRVTAPLLGLWILSGCGVTEIRPLVTNPKVRGYYMGEGRGVLCFVTGLRHSLEAGWLHIEITLVNLGDRPASFDTRRVSIRHASGSDSNRAGGIFDLPPGELKKYDFLFSVGPKFPSGRLLVEGIRDSAEREVSFSINLAELD